MVVEYTIEGATKLFCAPNMVRCALEMNAEKTSNSVNTFFMDCISLIFNTSAGHPMRFIVVLIKPSIITFNSKIPNASI